MTELQIFNNPDFGEIRTIEKDGEPWFVGKDVATALGYSDTFGSLKKHVDEEDKLVCQIDSAGQKRDVTIINESGLYSLVLSSKLPTAKKFKHWVTSEVLPSIRKTGSYHTPKTYLEALKALVASEEEKERLALENEQMKPKAEFYDAVTDSKDAIPMGEVAKVLDCGMGRNKLFEILRNKKILMTNNVPFQRFIDAGYFRVIETKYSKPNGDVAINIKTLVLQKGIDYIRKVLKTK
jgi:anti-repressor protein